LHAPGGIPHVSGEPFRTGGALGESYGRRMRGGTGTGAGAMRGRQRLGALLLLLAVLLAVKLGQQVYRWFAYAEERAQLQALSARLEGAGLEVMRTQRGADSLRARIEALDEDLAERKREVGAYDRHVRGGAPPSDLY